METIKLMSLSATGSDFMYEYNYDDYADYVVYSPASNNFWSPKRMIVVTPMSEPVSPPVPVAQLPPLEIDRVIMLD